MTILVIGFVTAVTILLCLILSDSAPNRSNRIRAVSYDGAPNGKLIVQYKCRFIGWVNLHRYPNPVSSDLAVFMDVDSARKFANMVREYGLMKWYQEGLDSEREYYVREEAGRFNGVEL